MTLSWQRWMLRNLSNVFIPANTTLPTADDHRDVEELANRVRMNDVRLDVLETRTEALERQQRKAHPV